MRKKTLQILIVALVTIFLSSSALAEVNDAGAGFILGLTALTPAAACPLAKLDLLPPSSPAARMVSGTGSAYFGTAVLRLDPRTAAGQYSPAYMRQNVRYTSMGDKLFTVSLFSAVALNVADYFSTLEALKRPGLQEGNPFMKNIVKSPVAFAAVKIGICAATYCGLKNIYKSRKPLAWVISAATNLAMSYVVSNNLRMLDSHPRAR